MMQDLGEWVVPVVCFIGTIAATVTLQSSRQMKHTANTVIRVSGLMIYPIKSCGGIRVAEARVTPRGFEWDRAFMLADAKGKFISQRRYPRMSLIGTKLDFEAGVLLVTAPGMEDLKIPLNESDEGAEVVKVNVWGDECNAVEVMKPKAAAWFQKFLELPPESSCRFVRMHSSSVRRTDPKYDPPQASAAIPQTSLADGYPFLLAGDTSLEELNRQLLAQNQQAVPMDRFRPNITVEGSLPFAEDRWGHISFGESIDMWVVKPCSRCTIPNVEQSTGIAHKDRQPSKAMKSIRSGSAIGMKKPEWARELFFGQNLNHGGQDGAVIRVGDVVTVRDFNDRFFE